MPNPDLSSAMASEAGEVVADPSDEQNTKKQKKNEAAEANATDTDLKNI